MCERAPKYGDDNEEVDDIANEMFTFIADEIENYQSKFGKMTPGILPVSGNLYALVQKLERFRLAERLGHL